MERLQYRDQINYKLSAVSEQQMDQQLQQLYDGVKHGDDVYNMYKKIRQMIYKQIKVQQLAVTKVLNDLLQIRLRSEKAFIIIMFYVANPLYSYSEVAEQYGLHKQQIHALIKKYAEDYPWLKNLFEIKGLQDSYCVKKPLKRAVRMKYQSADLFENMTDNMTDDIKQNDGYLTDEDDGYDGDGAWG